MMKKNNIKKGFTLVELSLAIVFISVLLLTIGWLTIHITSVYEKGLAMKAVNSSAKEIIDDVSRSIAASPARTISNLCADVYNPTIRQEAYNHCIDDQARKLSYQQRYANVEIAGETKQVPVNGVFCTGRYSYIWNTAYVLNDMDYKTTAKRANFNGSNDTFRFLKVSDFSRDLCKQHMSPDAYLYDDGYSYNHSTDVVVDKVGNTSTIGLNTAVDLLDSSENDIAIYDFTIFAPSVHYLTTTGFYSGTFILATLRGGIDINTTGDFCSDPPDNLNTDFAYCAINKFNFSMRAAGEKMRNE